MLEIVVHNWDELQRAVFEDVWDEKIMRYRANRIYRGAADKDWRLVPSLNRVCGHNLKLEQAVFRSFRKYGYADLAQYSGFWQLGSRSRSTMAAHAPARLVVFAAGGGALRHRGYRRL